jgi:hypothetical protein
MVNKKHIWGTEIRTWYVINKKGIGYRDITMFSISFQDIFVAIYTDHNTILLLVWYLTTYQLQKLWW